MNLFESSRDAANQEAFSSLMPGTREKAGFFSGLPTATVQTVGSILNDAAMPLADVATPALMPAAKKVDELFKTDVQGFLQREQQKTRDAMVNWTPDPSTVGWLGNVVYGVGNLLGDVALGTAATGNPYAGITYASGVQGYKAYRMGQYQGLDDATAGKMSAIAAGSTFLGAFLPVTATKGMAFGLTGLGMQAEVAGANIAAKGIYAAAGATATIAGNTGLKLAAGGALQAATGIPTRGLTSQVLRNAGYEDMAKQYEAFDVGEMASDFAIGALFAGGVHAYDRYFGVKPPEPKPSDLAAALALNNASHLETGTAPGIPTDPAARAAHVENINRAIEDLLSDREVDVSDNVTKVNFIENPVAVETRKGVMSAVEDHLGADWQSLKMELESRGLPSDTSQYSRGQGAGSTVELVVKSARESFGKDSQALVDNGVIKTVQSVSELPPRADGQPHPADTKAVFDGNTVHIVADNVAPSEVKGVVLHEVGAHYGMEQMLGAEGYMRLLSEIDAKVKAGVADFKMAADQVPADTPANQRMAETLAYLVQNRPELPLIQRLISQLKAAVYRLTGGRFVDLNADDIRTLAVAALKRVSSAEAAKTSGSMYSQLYRGPTFYSQLERGIAGAKQEKASAKDWLSIVSKLPGVKKEEIEATGLREYLELRGKDQITRNELVAYVQNNGLNIEEVEIGNLRDAAVAKEQEAAGQLVLMINAQDGSAIRLEGTQGKVFSDEAIYALQDGTSTPDQFPANMRDAARSYLEAYQAAQSASNTNTKYGQYTLPGGENYRELLLTLPDKGTTGQAEAFARAMYDKYGTPMFRDKLTPEERATFDNLNNTVQPYKSAHWDQRNVLAHVRFNDRVDADGNKVLFIEELQSDWAQEGRKKGFVNDKEKVKAFQVSIDGKPVTAYETRAEAEAHVQRAAKFNDPAKISIEEVMVERNDVQGPQKVPNAPFVTDTKAWTALTVKRMIRYAAENGYDKVAFVNGEQSAERYDLSKQVSKLYYSPPDSKQANKFGTVLKAFDHRGNEIINKAVTPDELPDYIGKEVANKLLSAEGNSMGVKSLEGLDLKVGGEGMISFYDKIVPQVVNDVLKKLGGGKLEDVNFSNHEGRFTIVDSASGKEVGRFKTVEAANKFMDQVKAQAAKGTQMWFKPENLVHQLDSSKSGQLGFTVTTEMRNKALEGQPLYAREPKPADTNQEKRDPYAPETLLSENPALTIATDSGAPILASQALADADAEIALAKQESQGYDAAVACALRG